MRLLFTLLVFFCISTSFSQKNPAVSWEFDTKEDELGTPRTEIFLLVDGKKNFVGKGIGEFFELPANNFSDSQYQIPAKAISACSGFWAGLGHRLYVIHKGDFLLVQEGFLESESSKRAKIRFKTIKKIPLNPQK